jgi:hypothetical protein
VYDMIDGNIKNHNGYAVSKIWQIAEFMI